MTMVKCQPLRHSSSTRATLRSRRHRHHIQPKKDPGLRLLLRTVCSLAVWVRLTRAAASGPAQQPLCVPPTRRPHAYSCHLTKRTHDHAQIAARDRQWRRSALCRSDDRRSLDSTAQHRIPSQLGVGMKPRPEAAARRRLEEEKRLQTSQHKLRSKSRSIQNLWTAAVSIFLAVCLSEYAASFQSRRCHHSEGSVYVATELSAYAYKATTFNDRRLSRTWQV